MSVDARILAVGLIGREQIVVDNEDAAGWGGAATYFAASCCAAGTPATALAAMTAHDERDLRHVLAGLQSGVDFGCGTRITSDIVRAAVRRRRTRGLLIRAWQRRRRRAYDRAPSSAPGGTARIIKIQPCPRLPIASQYARGCRSHPTIFRSTTLCSGALLRGQVLPSPVERADERRLPCVHERGRGSNDSRS